MLQIKLLTAETGNHIFWYVVNLQNWCQLGNKMFKGSHHHTSTWIYVCIHYIHCQQLTLEDGQRQWRLMAWHHQQLTVTDGQLHQRLMARRCQENLTLGDSQQQQQTLTARSRQQSMYDRQRQWRRLQCHKARIPSNIQEKANLCCSTRGDWAA